MKYDVIIVGAGPGGIFSSYELVKLNPNLKIGVFESGYSLEKRHCPIDGDKVKSCIKCKTCAIMSGFGGAGAFSDGKYNITNDFGGTLYEYIGRKEAMDLMKYVDEINVTHGGEGTKMYSTAGTGLKKVCMQNKLKLLDASVRHLGTDINYVVLQNIYDELKDKVDFHFDEPVLTIEKLDNGFKVFTDKGRYIVKLLNPNIMKRPTAMNNFNTADKLEEILKDNNIDAVYSLKFNDKKMQELDGQYFYVYEWFDGKSLKDDEITIEHCKKIGKLLAYIHNIDLKKDEVKTKTKNIDFKYYIDLAKEKGSVIYDMIYDKLNILNESMNKGNISVNDLPKFSAICHNDMDSKNVMWLNDDYKLIDLECLG